MVNDEIKYNLKALTDVIMANHKLALERVDTLVLSLHHKTGDEKEQIVNKDELYDGLISIFDNEINNIDNITIYYICDSEKKYITNINID